MRRDQESRCLPLRRGEVCRCSAHQVVDIISFHGLVCSRQKEHKPPTSLSIKMHSTFSNLFKRHRTTLASPYHLIGEVQHISSCILLRNQQPMTLHQNFILTNQIQIKKQADWLLSHYYVHNPFSSTLHDTTIHSLDPQPGRWIYTLNF